MKPAGLFLVLSAGVLVVASADQPRAGLVSTELKARIREGLPTYKAPKPEATTEGETEPTAQTADPTILVLPKLTVKESRLPPDAADHLMSRRDFKRKMENIYLDSVAEAGPLNAVLNSFTIPLFSPSKAARGRAIHARRELDRLNHVNETSRSLDRDAAKKFKRDLDNSHTTRPAGTK